MGMKKKTEKQKIEQIPCTIANKGPNKRRNNPLEQPSYHGRPSPELSSFCSTSTHFSKGHKMKIPTMKRRMPYLAPSEQQRE